MALKTADAKWFRCLRDAPHPRVVVMRALKLGDLLCSVPAFRALRAGLPKAEIVLVGLPWAREFAARYPRYIDGFREFPGFPGLPEREPDLVRLPQFLQEMQREQFDLAIQLHGSGSYVNSIVALFAAQRMAGFFLPGEWCPDTDLFLPWLMRGLEIRRLLNLMGHLELPNRDEALEFPIREPDVEGLRRIEGVYPLDSSDYVCIHPGASVPERRWPAEFFATVADRLADFGLQIVLTGSSSERHLTRAVARTMRAHVLDLAGQTSLGVLAALLRGARLLVANDTGISHLSAAVGTPSVIISTGDNPDRWAPIDTHRHRVLCSANGVPVGTVTDQAEALLAEFRAKPHFTAPREGERLTPALSGEPALIEG